MSPEAQILARIEAQLAQVLTALAQINTQLALLNQEVFAILANVDPALKRPPTDKPN